jgi:hypothetical protein
MLEKRKLRLFCGRKTKEYGRLLRGLSHGQKRLNLNQVQTVPKCVGQSVYLTENNSNNSLRIFHGITHLTPHPHHLIPSLSHPAPQPTQQRILHQRQRQQQWSRRGLRHTHLTRTGTLWGSECGKERTLFDCNALYNFTLPTFYSLRHLALRTLLLWLVCYLVCGDSMKTTCPMSWQLTAQLTGYLAYLYAQHHTHHFKFHTVQYHFILS